MGQITETNSLDYSLILLDNCQKTIWSCSAEIIQVQSYSFSVDKMHGGSIFLPSVSSIILAAFGNILLNQMLTLSSKEVAQFDRFLCRCSDRHSDGVLNSAMANRGIC